MIYLLPLLLIFSSLYPIQLRLASTPEETCWGLMNERTLPENEGMLFDFGTPRVLSFWMFNVWIDLSLAYLDNEGTIVAIHTMKSFPQLMDPKRPVRQIKDMALYPPQDPICRFFRAQSISSECPVRYALEVNKGWFERHNVNVGDRMTWDVLSKQAKFSSSCDSYTSRDN